MTIFFKENFKFTLFVYLVNFYFLRSIAQCLHFLVYHVKNPMIDNIGFFSVLFIVLFGLFFPKLKNLYLNIIFNEISLKIIMKLKEFLVVAQKKYSYISFILFHLYVIFSLCHFLMVFHSNLDTNIELCFQYLNFLRLLLFPLVLFIVASHLFPNFFKMEQVLGEASTKVVQEITLQVLEFIKEKGNFKRSPKSASLMYGTGALIGGAYMHKTSLTEQLENTTARFGLNMAQVPECLLGDPEAQVLYRSTLQSISQVDQSSFSILARDVLAFLKGNPTLRERLAKNLGDFKAAEALAVARRERSQSEGQELSLSPLAKESLGAPEDLPGSSITKIQSIVEKFLFDN